MTTIQLEGVALRTHDDSYPFDVDPFDHQVSMRRLIRDDERFVAVNDSPTGGGKTSSWLAPAFEEERDVIAVYPTNALIADQYEELRRVADEEIDHDVAVLRVTASSLADKSDEFDVNSNGAALDDWLRVKRRSSDQQILLTNPDIFVMLRRDLYRNTNRMYKGFEMAVVDEFHRAGRKEQNTLRYLLDEMQDEDDAVVALRQVAFLSATPEERQERLFEEAMAAPYYRVTRNQEDEKASFVDPPSTDWHSVMPPVELDVRAAQTFGTADKLLEEGESTLTFCRNGRTVVMLDGIHEVGRVHSWLDDEIAGNVERIDGFYGENKEAKLERFDVLVSNSAVEVGIDFDVERILFAGNNRDSFLQRLGRLRSESEHRHARCYVPQSIANALSEFDGETLTRSALDDILDDVYPQPRQPETFDTRYSAAEGFEHLDNRLRDAPLGKQDSIKRSSLARIKRHFGVGQDTEFTLHDMEAFTETLDWRILTQLQWYRGDSVQALVYDRPRDRLTSYDLFYLLRYGDVQFYDRQSFDRLIPDKYSTEIDRHSHYVDGFCTYDGTIETDEDGYGRDVYFSGGTLYDWIDGTSDTGRKPKSKTGLTIGVDPSGTGSRVSSITEVNERLRSRGDRADEAGSGLLCYPVSGTPTRVKRQYDLGEFFFLYPIRVQSKDLHSLAIGTDALYLHCHVLEQNQRLSGGTGDIDFLDDI